MKKIIALDDGHGMTTPGKRSPILPDGTYMPENEFNRTVVKYLAQDLERNGFLVLLVAPGDDDTPLATRTGLANNTIKNKYNCPADIYISVHANAATGNWNNATGLETFIYTKTDSQTERLGRLVRDNLLKGTFQKDRGLKRADFHVLRETHMPAVLVECGFMDNKSDIQLLLSDSFRRECAEEICKAVCEFHGVKYMDESNLKDKEGFGVIFKTVKDVPECGKATIDKLISKGYLKGDGKGNINIPEEILRVYVVNDRAGLYGN